MAETTRERTAADKRGGHADAGKQDGRADAHHVIKAQNLTAEERRFLEEHADELNKTTLRAKWIHGRDERADRPGQSLATRDHETIKRWAEERDAKPATVPGTDHDGRPGVLRFNFPGYGGRELQEIGWDEWFRPFDERNLVFVFQDQKKNGDTSNFFILDNPEREDA